MRRKPRRHAGPPRLLLGISLLFWGAALEKPLVGLICALAVEARWWTDLRWSFGERGYVRAWSLSIALLALVTTWFWFLGEGGLHLFEVMVWLPVYLLPMILAQQYGTSDTMPLNTFSFIARRRMEMDRREGRNVEALHVNIGYAYFCGVLLAAAVARSASRSGQFMERWWFFGGTLLLVALALFFVSPLSRRRPWAWAFAVLLVAVSSFGVTVGLLGLYSLLQGQNFGRLAGVPLASQSRTAIGKVGEIKLSYEIYWRAKGDVPPLLRETVFNRYRRGIWVHMPPEGMNRYDDFEEAVLGTSGDEGKQFAFRREDLGLKRTELKEVTLRGASHQLTPLPLPPEARMLEQVEADGLFFNSLGTVLADNPDFGVLDFTARYGGTGHFEQLPTERDFELPEEEAGALSRVSAALGLAALSDQKKLDQIHRHFLRNFAYTLYAGKEKAGGRKPTRTETAKRTDSGPLAGEAIGRFLEETRAGHCEYFATAGVLLLRAAGVPARYCVGFSAHHEFDKKRQEYVLRGKHTHAWCRAYIGGRQVRTTQPDGTTAVTWTGGEWVDFDPTPPSWMTVEGTKVPWQRKFLDWLQRVREDFLLWRTRPGNISTVSWGMGSIGALLLAYVAVRLWLSRTRTGSGKRRRGRPGGRAAVTTPLHSLEKPAEKWIGPRPDGVAQTRWLMQLAEALPELEPDLEQAVRLHWKARFDPLGVEVAEEERLREVCRKVAKGMKGMKGRGAPGARKTVEAGSM